MLTRLLWLAPILQASFPFIKHFPTYFTGSITNRPNKLNVTRCYDLQSTSVISQVGGHSFHHNYLILLPHPRLVAHHHQILAVTEISTFLG